MIKRIDYRKLIETGFDIIDKTGTRRPFILNDVQGEYLDILKKDYPNNVGIRDNILKARQQGFSALIDAVLVCDFLIYPNVGGQIISHKKEETEVLMNRVNFYLESYCEKQGIDKKYLLQEDRKDYFKNRLNGSYLFIGTAGAKTLGRGGTLQNIHWSETGFYPNTTILSAERLVTAAEQQVATGIGKIFRESTGNMVGDYFYRECERSRRGENTYKFRFFPWYHNPEYQTVLKSSFTANEDEERMMRQFNLTPEQMFWYRNKASEFDNKSRTLFLREYPSTPEEAFLTSGSAFFDADTLKYYYENTIEPIQTGGLAFDGSFI